MYQVGLTGGIAAGKSTVVDRLHRVHGFLVVDADRLAREVIAPGTPGLAEVANAFGQEAIDATGHMDRKVVGEKIFNDPDTRAVLEGIIHPRIEQLRQAIINESGASVIIHDIPLLIETNMQDRFDEIVVIHTPAITRVQRLIHDRGMVAEDAWARVNAQVSDEERLAHADTVIDNTGSLDALHAQVDALATRLHRYAGS